jgi:hypothetical protein
MNDTPNACPRSVGEAVYLKRVVAVIAIVPQSPNNKCLSFNTQIALPRSKTHPIDAVPILVVQNGDRGG